MRRGMVVAALVACLSLPAMANAGRPVTGPCQTVFCAGVSQDGSRVVFPFEGELTAGSGKRQIYEWSAGGTRALLPPGSGRWFMLNGVSADAAHVFVTTSVALGRPEIDGLGLFDFTPGGPAPVLTGMQAGGGPISFMGSSPDGGRVFFDASSPLTPDDLDSCPDLYQRSAGQTTLIGPNPAPPPPPICESAAFGGVSADGSHLFFVSGGELEPGDDHGEDIYQQVGSSLTRLTTYPEPEGGCVDLVKFADSSNDGSTVLFSTSVPVVPEDTDSAPDVYKRRSDGAFVLVSRGTDGEASCAPWTGDLPLALSADGRTTIFETTSRLSAADADSSNDLYSAEDSGAIELISTGPTDANVDERSPVSPDWLALVSDDAKRVAFETPQRLVAADKDAVPDVYLRASGQTELISSGLAGKATKSYAELLGFSADGSTVVFATRDALVASDLDRERDVYLHRSGQRGSILLSGEKIPPRVRISRHGRVLKSGRIVLTLSCPKSETSGPCRGRLLLKRSRRGPRLGAASFRLAPGDRARISLRLRPLAPAPPRLAFARVRGVDALGNAKVMTKAIALAGSGGRSRAHR